MLSKKVMAAILAAINAYADQEQAAKRTTRWTYAGRLQATRNHLQWASRDRR